MFVASIICVHKKYKCYTYSTVLFTSTIYILNYICFVHNICEKLHYFSTFDLRSTSCCHFKIVVKDSDRLLLTYKKCQPLHTITFKFIDGRQAENLQKMLLSFSFLIANLKLQSYRFTNLKFLYPLWFS